MKTLAKSKKQDEGRATDLIPAQHVVPKCLMQQDREILSIDREAVKKQPSRDCINSEAVADSNSTGQSDGGLWFHINWWVPYL